MKKMLLTVAVCAAISASASDFPYMAFRLSNGTESVVKSDGLRFEVSGGKLIVKYADGTSTFTLAELSSMAFANNQSGVESISSAAVTDVTVYTSTGVCLGCFSSPEAARDAIKTPGVYLFKTEQGTTKILIK